MFLLTFAPSYIPIEFRICMHNDIEVKHHRRHRHPEDGHTHNVSFIQKPLEVVFLDVHQAGDVGDVEAVVLHVVGL